MGNANELLGEYARSGSESVFRELVDRHVNMVYSAALREADGNPTLAAELTQLVFVGLGRKAASLIPHPALAGWLYTSVRWMAANARRAEDRRQRRRLEYQTMSELHSSESPESTWQQVRPVLDDVLHELGETDRAVIVLRYFEDLSLKQVGQQLGLNENAARMRVDRALEKLHDLLSRRGIKSTSTALASPGRWRDGVCTGRASRLYYYECHWAGHNPNSGCTDREASEIYCGCKETRAYRKHDCLCVWSDRFDTFHLVSSESRAAASSLADAVTSVCRGFRVIQRNKKPKQSS